MNKIEFTFIHTNGVTLLTAVAGPESGPLVVLLHGFPEFWYGWRRQVNALVDAGYRVVMPDQRGYNLSQKPEGIENYQIDLLRDDVIGLITYFGREKAVIIGHDWGGIVAWHLASSQPQYVEKLIAINCPHPAIMKKWTNFLPLQWVRSLYMLFFQLRTLPENLLSVNHYKVLEKLLMTSSKSGTFKKEELNHYQASWAQSGSVSAMLNWYRAMRKGTLNQVVPIKIDLPVLIIWGTNDSFLSSKLARESSYLCSSDVRIILVDATHWVHLERPQVINQTICNFLLKS